MSDHGGNNVVHVAGEEVDAGDAGEQFSSMQHVNREGSYQLSHAYDRFIDTASFSRVKNRKN